MTTPVNADPFAMWRDWVSNSERQWNSFLNDAMSTDQFGESMARFMDLYLNMQKNMNEVMGRYLTVLNIPTRGDVVALGDRLANIEDRLSGIESAVKRPATAAAAAAPAPAEAAKPKPRPARTRKPAKA